jgi:hypothetical protein
MTHKIAFLFLIYDEINHEDLWIDFFNQDQKNRHTIYIHYKWPYKSEYFDRYKLKNCIPTKWGDISLVRAQNVLLKEAMKDPMNKLFIFCSNSCVPLKKFDTVYHCLNPLYSYFNLYDMETTSPRCIDAMKYIDQMFIKKASQWCILNRKHTNLILSSDEYIKWFENTVGDEHCYITYLHYKKLVDELRITINSPESATTFTNWAMVPYRYRTTRGLKNYNSIGVDELFYLVKSKCLFGRKFTKDCDLQLLKKILNFKKRNGYKLYGSQFIKDF